MIHRFSQPDDFHLCPDEFYHKFGGVVPEGAHHEIEILAPGLGLLDLTKHHILRSRHQANRLFVCYPLPMASVEDAVGIFRTWCLGTVVTLVKGVDLNTILGECDNNHARMEAVIKERYGIEITES